MDEELLRALNLGLSAHRGYADFDSWADRPVRDLGLGRDFVEAVQCQFGVAVGDIRVTPAGCDPPDLLASTDHGIELTELVDRSQVEAAVRLKRAGQPHGQYREWSRDELREKLSEIIAIKDAARPKVLVPLREYWLVIHTDEPGLSPDLVRQYLEGWTPRAAILITRCFLMMSYFPGLGRPLFELSVTPGERPLGL
ncbi:MAG: hypothetical protein V9E87_02240 [Gemmatimonadales bacterium]